MIEILSPDDRMKATLEQFREYEQLGVRHIVQMDPEDKVTHIFEQGNLVRKDIEELCLDEKRRIPFDNRALLSRVDDE